MNYQCTLPPSQHPFWPDCPAQLGMLIASEGISLCYPLVLAVPQIKKHRNLRGAQASKVRGTASHAYACLCLSAVSASNGLHGTGLPQHEGHTYTITASFVACIFSATRDTAAYTGRVSALLGDESSPVSSHCHCGSDAKAANVLQRVWCASEASKA